ncbi:MAG: DUF2851 family protein [Bacteroidales bacterium]|nr:DUF2851 family protein [Bacteroidales bacterium]
MEELMYFVWQQRLFLTIETPDHQPLDILHPGLRNYDAGPDFFNAKVKEDGIVWAGNVEMHVKASDWYRHHHQDDPAYDSVILHVVMEPDTEVRLRNGTPIKTVVMHIPDDLMKRYRQLCSGSSAPLLPGQVPTYSSISCSSRLDQVPNVVLHDWLTALCTQRMIEKLQRVRDLVEGQLKAWPEAFYVVLTRSLGTGVNSDNMERLARSLPYSCLLHHKDNFLQIQALLLGQAGLLQMQDAESKDAKDQQEWRLMQREYAFLRQKFSLTPLNGSYWKMGRVRPPAQPEARLRALAKLIWTHQDLFDEVLEANSLEQLEKIFGGKGLGRQTVRSLIINAVVPLLLAYAQWQGDDERCEKALNLLEELPPESNRYINQWIEAGITVKSAMDTQALLHLFKNYCQPHKCLRCRIGCWLLKKADTSPSSGESPLQVSDEIPF